MPDLAKTVHAALLAQGMQREARAVQLHGVKLDQDCEKIGVGKAKEDWSRLMRESKGGSAFVIAPHGKEDQATLLISVAAFAGIVGAASVRLGALAATPSPADLLAPLAGLPPAQEQIQLLGGEDSLVDVELTAEVAA